MKYPSTGWQIFWRTAGRMAAGFGWIAAGILLAKTVCRFLGI